MCPINYWNFAMSNDLIVKSNVVITASYHLTANEQRLILSAISQIPKGVEVQDEEVYTVEVSDFIEMGVHPKTAYREMREAAERLYERSIVLKVGDDVLKTRWVQDMGVGTGEGMIKLAQSLGLQPTKMPNNQHFVVLRFSKSILPYLSNLSANFTQYLKQDIAGLSSSYSIRFFELLMQFKDTGFRKITIEDLREFLDLGDKYPATKDLKVRVIETAVNEINEKTKINVEYKLVKTGKKFTHLELKFKLKAQANKTAQPVGKTIDMIESEKKNPLALSWQIKGLSDGQINKLAKFKKEFLDANSSLLASNDSRSYDEVFNSWRVLLKDPTSVKKFKNIQEILERSC